MLVFHSFQNAVIALFQIKLVLVHKNNHFLSLLDKACIHIQSASDHIRKLLTTIRNDISHELPRETF